MKPGHLDLPTMWRGCTYPGFSLTWLRSDSGLPIDLTDWTPLAMSKHIDLHPFIDDARNGLTHIYLTPEETIVPLGVEQWDWVWVNNVTGIVTPPLLSGTIPVKEPVTPVPEIIINI